MSRPGLARRSLRASTVLNRSPRAIGPFKASTTEPSSSLRSKRISAERAGTGKPTRPIVARLRARERMIGVPEALWGQTVRSSAQFQQAAAAPKPAAAPTGEKPSGNGHAPIPDTRADRHRVSVLPPALAPRFKEGNSAGAYQSCFQPGRGLREPRDFGSGNGMVLMGSGSLARTTSFSRPTSLRLLSDAPASPQNAVRPRSRTTTFGRAVSCTEGGVRPRSRRPTFEGAAGCALVSVFASHIRRMGR